MLDHEQGAGAHLSHSGFIAIVGRPNVGKSTLLNHILGQKVSITSRKPQTTRHQILGIKTEGDYQSIFVDTPGLHLKQEKAINKLMNKAATDSLKDIDVAVFLVDKTRWTEEDEFVLSLLKNVKAPVILAINKVDQSKDKNALLPHIEQLAAKFDFAEIIPLSAKQGHNVDTLETLVKQRLPEGMHYYPEDQVTDKSMRFLAAESIREKLMRQLGEELPYAVTVEIEEYRYDQQGVAHISALVLVEREGQKRIIIGRRGEQLKIIGRDARKDLERQLEHKVMLNLWVKVKSGWADDERALRSLGYDEGQ